MFRSCWSRWSRWKRLLAAGLGALAVLACAAPEPTEAPREQSLVFTNLVDITSINDLTRDGSIIGREIERFLFLQLVKEGVDPETRRPSWHPQLAESWEFSGDRRTLTFHLREASWSDGAPITAEDVRWTWEGQVHPEIAWRAARTKEKISDVEIIDPRTVRFHFEETYPDQLEDANTGVILPKHAWGARDFSEWRASGGWFQETIVSSGPFVLERWEPNQQVTMRRNPLYYREGRPKLDRLVLRVVPEKTGQISQLLGGSVDYVQIVPPDQLDRLEEHGDIEIDPYWGRNFDFICWNLLHEPLDDVRVRRALVQAMDRQAILDSIYQGYGRVARTSLLSTTWAAHPTLEPWPFSLKAAREGLESAGYRDSDGDGIIERAGKPLTLELLVQNGNRSHLDAATLIQAQLARVGVELELRRVEFKTWLERSKAQEFEATFGIWEIPTSLNIRFAFHSESIGKYNFGSYSNQRLDELVERFEETSDFESRTQILREVQEILHEDQPYAFLWETQKLNARHRKVRDGRPNLLSPFINIDEWWIDDELR